ncbi:uncharacterized protein LOC119414588 [Nematolebias whitei]|uniref:uncharacterized protein LOC119414588 n=1 Tax=Nematolebias whitei TaxID=451745 RepID=UPI0018998417|nr:uncharacterized protein LOC119414588 [Nematolebias whitei]
MPAAKGKGHPTFQRYRPASEYDDATLAQKREYWRNKKREQRARLSEQIQKPRQDRRKEKIPYLYVSAGVNTSLSDSALSPSFRSNDDLYNCPSKTENTVETRSTDTATSRREDWPETNNNTVLCNSQPTSCSVVAPTDKEGAVLMKCQTRMSANSVATSLTSSRTRPSIGSSVPVVRLTKITDGSSIKTEPQPCASMQSKLDSKTQLKDQILLPIQLTALPSEVATDTTSHSPVSSKTKGKTTGPESGTKSALITERKAKGVGSVQLSLESEEEKAAKRREHWRIKKREQRAKLAKVKERIQNRDMMSQKLTAHKMGLVASSVLPSQLVLRAASQKQCAVRVKVPYLTIRQETTKLQDGLASVAGTNLQINQVKAQNYHKNRIAQTSVTAFDVNSVKKPVEPQRNLSFVNPCVPRGIARCKTPRQRFIDAQKNFMNQRNLRYRPPTIASLFPTMGMPKIDPNDTPEQIIAKRREYWRVKKREQRAKLSFEMKTRVREKDALIRRVTRYQQILAEMRKTRALAQATGSDLNPASETIGGFIKEDGTLTANIPKGLKSQNTVGFSKAITVMQEHHRTNMKTRGVDPITVNQLRPPHHSFPLTDNKTPRLLLIKPQSQINTPTVESTQLATKSFQNAESKPESDYNGCVMKMAVSSHVPLLASQDQGLTEEERMAKKREYWRIKKREQRAARAVRLKLSVLQARTSSALLRRKVQRQELATTVQMNRSRRKCTGNAEDLNHTTTTVPDMPHVNEIKQESSALSEADLNSPPQQGVCPYIKPPTFTTAPPAQQPESDSSLSTDSQATTLLAVASMKKLLEESLSTVTECQTKEIKRWEPGSDVSEQKETLSSSLNNSPKIIDTLPPHPTCSEVEHSTGELSSQTPPNFTLDLSLEASNNPASPPKTRRFCSKETTHQNYCSSEPPKLHHIPDLSPEHSEPQQQFCEQQSGVPEQYQNNNMVSTPRSCHVVAGHSGLTSLQKKREYWKLMKRQQRARLRAQQKEQHGESSCCQLFPTNIEVREHDNSF